MEDSPKKKKKGKPARLKTQKGSLGKSQGQRQKRKEARQAENPKGWYMQKLGPKKKKRKEKKPARLKTQKGSLGKSQGQRKEKKRKILPSGKLDDAT